MRPRLACWTNSLLMSRALNFADTFYHMRFIVEKEGRVRGLIE